GSGAIRRQAAGQRRLGLSGEYPVGEQPGRGRVRGPVEVQHRGRAYEVGVGELQVPNAVAKPPLPKRVERLGPHTQGDGITPPRQRFRYLVGTPRPEGWLLVDQQLFDHVSTPGLRVPKSN